MSAVEVGYQSGSLTDNLVAKPAKKMAEFRILLPDQSVYSFELPRNCTGQECLDQMCDILGIVERDYFSLQYVDKSSGCSIWLNKRLQVREQLDTSGPPYQLKFAVRFYTDAELLLQPNTIEAFYKDLKYQVKRGDIRIPDSKKSTVGAQLAQAEFGDFEQTSDLSKTFVYPPYYPEQEWNDGIAYLIAKEHKRLKGVSKRDAQLLFIHEVYQNEFYGVVYVSSIMSDGQDVILAVGAKCVRIYNSRMTCIKKVPYHALCQIAFALRFFTMTYQVRDDDHQLVEKRLKFILPNRTVAKSLFRMIAEDQIFFYQETVTEKVRNHADNSFKKWKKFCRKMFRKKYHPKYYYDIERTKREAYRHSWQLLHQVSGSTESASTVPIPQPASLNFININLVNDSDEEDSGTNTNMKSEVCWGLSESSCNLAKELLSAPQLNLAELEENLLSSNVESKENDDDKEAEKKVDESATEGKTEPLSGAQGKKLCRLLLKIQDERLCTVCMDELISSVFCPCGHYVACSKCARRLDRCPVCRQPVGYVQHVYTRF